MTCKERKHVCECEVAYESGSGEYCASDYPCEGCDCHQEVMKSLSSARDKYFEEAQDLEEKLEKMTMSRLFLLSDFKNQVVENQRLLTELREAREIIFKLRGVK